CAWRCVLLFGVRLCSRLAAFLASATFFASGLLNWLFTKLTVENRLANAQYSSCVQRSVGGLWHWAHSSRTPRNATATFSPHCSIGTCACRRQNMSSVFFSG